jgi:hypothetical protein
MTAIAIPDSISPRDIQDVLKICADTLSAYAGRILASGVSINTPYLGELLQATAFLDRAAKSHEQGERNQSGIAVPAMMPPRGRGMN